MLVLWNLGVLIKKKLDTASKKKNFLEVVNDQLEVELDLLVKGVDQQLRGFKYRVGKMMEM